MQASARLKNNYGTMVPFRLTEKLLQYVGRNLTKEVEDLYEENDKTLKKE